MFEDIKEQFRSVIQWSQRIPNPQLDTLFDDWYAAKKRFIDGFGGLIYEYPETVEFTLNEQTQRNRALQFSDFVYDSFDNEELSVFIDKNVEGFFENRVVKGDGIAPEGMKLIKAFKYFESDKKKLQIIQDYASQLIQENKIKGTLCFSVHPLDFLSSSENTYNWRSCHALDGEYRAGNLSYMVDKTTFMVYLKGEDNVVLPAFGENVLWNSKKWRVLMHFSECGNMLFAGRSYPFSSESGLDIALEIFKNIEDKINPDNRYAFSNWENTYVDKFIDKLGLERFTSVKYLYASSKLFELRDIVSQHPNGLNYNDLLESTCYTYPYYAYRVRSKQKNLKTNPIQLGGPVLCLHCGNELITNPGTMRCDHCEFEYGYEENDDITSCSCCGTRIWVDDGVPVEPYGELVCENCMKTECFICENCGNVFYKNEMKYIDNENGEGFVCADCRDSILEYEQERKEFGPIKFYW